MFSVVTIPDAAFAILFGLAVTGTTSLLAYALKQVVDLGRLVAELKTRLDGVDEELRTFEFRFNDHLNGRQQSRRYPPAD